MSVASGTTGELTLQAPSNAPLSSQTSVVKPMNEKLRFLRTLSCCWQSLNPKPGGPLGAGGARLWAVAGFGALQQGKAGFAEVVGPAQPQRLLKVTSKHDLLSQSPGVGRNIN